MALWKDGRFVEDDWRIAVGEEPVGADGAAIVTLARWRAERDALASRNAPLGLLLSPGDDWTDIVSDLPRFPVIAVSFPSFADGRGFSYARLLRDRDAYTGEIRAVGGFFLDQMPLMRRVGIDAFATDDPAVIRALEAGLWPEVPEYLQPVSADREVPAGTRPWARRPADSRR